MTTTKVFQNGNSQVVRLPKAFRFDVPEVEIFRRGDEVVLRKKPQNMVKVFDLLTALSDDFMESGRDQPPVQSREPL
ncbi:MAG: antitoxin [Desulfobacterales bacterium]|nr:antitoxin [Desulfobacterales bacterium]MBI9085343.1 antitoxin [Desulfobacterales bacterium]